MTLNITLIPALQTNYIYLLQDGDTVSVVDPSESAPVIDFLQRHNLPLHYILNTHHHYDHIGGNTALKKQYSAQIVAPAKEHNRIAAIDIPVVEGDSLNIGQETVQILETPGHTTGHVVYYFQKSGTLFCGDTLFSLGCGRLFEGTPAQMWHSLCRLRALPPETKIYCGHEYTQDNARFAKTIEPANAALKAYTKKITKMRASGHATLPSTIAEERACNPFFRADQPIMRQVLKMKDATDTEIFAEIRRRKDMF